MIPMLLCLSVLTALAAQEPVPPASPPDEPAQQEPAPPSPQKPARSREDRLEQRVVPQAPEGPPESGSAPTPAEPTPPAAEEPAKPPDPLEGWPRLNGCALIVNEELTTYLDFDRGVERRMASRTRGTVDRQQMFSEEIVSRARTQLELQAGKDVGFPPEQVDRFVRRQMQDDVEKSGSITQFAAELKQEGLDSFERKEEYYARVHQILWVEAVTGRAAGPSGRKTIDGYVRPGFVLFVQREAVRRQPETRSVMLTQMVVRFEGPGVSQAPAGAGSAGDENLAAARERAREKLLDLRSRVENGEDMGEVAEQAGACTRGTKGRTGFLLLSGLREDNPAVAGFLEKAEVGELSPALEFLVDGKPIGLIVVRAEEFKVTPVPPFDEPAAQRNWIRSQTDRAADMRVQTGLGRLLEAAYVWPPNLFGNR